MAKIQIIKNAQVEIDGQSYVFGQFLAGNVYMFLNAQDGEPYRYFDAETGENRFPKQDEVEDLLATGRMKLTYLHAGNKRAPKLPIEYDRAIILSKDPKAAARLWWTEAYDVAPCALSDAALLRFIKALGPDAIANGHHLIPSPSSLRRWVQNRGSVDERPLGAMVSASGRGPRQSRLCNEILNTILVALEWYWSERGHTMQEAHDLVSQAVGQMNVERAPFADPFVCPSYETVRKRIRDAETADRYAAKFGKQAAKIRYGASSDNRLRASRILEKVIVDHTRIDTMVCVSGQDGIVYGRPWLVLMVDVKSRCIVGWFLSFEDPSIYTVAELFKRAVRFKPHLRKLFPHQPDGSRVGGKPSEILLDHGVETNGSSFRDAMHDVGIGVTWCAVKEPQQKAIGERAFKTLNTKIFHKLQGSVPLPPELMRRMGYDPVKDRVVLLEEINFIVEQGVNLYHYSLHTGIDDLPIRVWLKDAEAGIPAFDQPEIVDKAMGLTEVRSLTKDGITLFGLQYCTKKKVDTMLDHMAESCAKRRRAKGSATARVKVKYNPANMGSVQVFDSKTNRYEELACIDRDYAEGLPIWRHKALRAFVKAEQLEFCSEKDRRDARIAMRRTIETCCPDMTARVRRQLARQLGEEALKSWTNRIGLLAVPEDIPVIPQTPAVEGRRDGGVPRKTPQRGKSRRQSRRPQEPVIELVGDMAVDMPRLVSDIDVSADNDGWDLDGFAA